MKHYLLNGLLLGVLLFLAAPAQRVLAQSDEVQAIRNLQERVSSLENQLPARAHEGVMCFLFGAFCALWAQNTGRNAWLWFFMGLFFNIITVLVLLYKNSKDRRLRLQEARTSGSA